MSKNYYTNVAAVGNNIFYRGVKDGRRIKLKIAYEPTLFLRSNKTTTFKSLEGVYLEPMKFESMREARDFVNSRALSTAVEPLVLVGTAHEIPRLVVDQHRSVVANRHRPDGL